MQHQAPGLATLVALTPTPPVGRPGAPTRVVDLGAEPHGR